MRVGDDRRVHIGVTVEVELLQFKWHAIARVKPVQALASVGTRSDGPQVELGMAPQQVRRQSPRKACRAGDKCLRHVAHPQRTSGSTPPSI